MSTSTLTNACRASKARMSQRPQSVITREPDRSLVKIDDWFLPSQWKWINETNLFAVAEKGRRVGISEAQSYRSNRFAMLNKLNTYYSTYNLHAGKTFISKCAKWARAFNQISLLSYGKPIIDENMITTYRVQYLNGRFIEAIPSNAQNFRDKENCEIVKDEAAHDIDLAEILIAVNAVNMWGLPIRIISTHWGEKNEFNKLCIEIKANPTLGVVHFYSFYDAIEEGLYKKMCQVNGEVWTKEKEVAYVQREVLKYGIYAPQELGAIPQKGGSGKIFHESHFHYESFTDLQIRDCTKIRGWDFAATAKIDAKKTHFYTVTILFGLIEEKIVALNIEARQVSTSDREDWVVEQAEEDDQLTYTLIEQEPGSQSESYIEHVGRRIRDKNVIPVKSNKNKLQRATPVVAALKYSDFVLLAENRDHLEKWIVTPMVDFDGSPQPLINDVTDVVSLVYNYVMENMTGDWIAG